MLYPCLPPALIHLAQSTHPTIAYPAIHTNDNNHPSAFTWSQKHLHAHSTALSCSINSQHRLPVAAHYSHFTSTFGLSTGWTTYNPHAFKTPLTSKWTNLQPTQPYAVVGFENCHIATPLTHKPAITIPAHNTNPLFCVTCHLHAIDCTLAVIHFIPYLTGKHNLKPP